MEKELLKKDRDLLVGLATIILLPLIFLIGIYLIQGSIEGIKDWLVPVSGYVSLISIAAGTWLAVNEYRLKIQTEKRLTDASIVQSDIDLLVHFSKTMNIAQCWSEPIVSEKAIEKLFDKVIVSEGKSVDVAKIREILVAAILIPPHGRIAQDAAIGAIGTLGKRHDILIDAAIEGLNSIELHIKDERELSKKYHDELCILKKSRESIK